MVHRLLVKMTLYLLPILLALGSPLLAYDRYQNLEERDHPLFERLSKDLRCPTCQGLSVWESDANFSNQIKDMIKIKINDGLTEEQIREFFTARFGPWILREPPIEGFNAVAWWLPLSLMFGGPVILWVCVWRRRRLIPSHGVRTADDLIKQMHDELAVLRRDKRC